MADLVEETVRKTVNVLQTALNPGPLVDTNPALDNDGDGTPVPVPGSTPMSQAERTALIRYIGTNYTPIATKPAPPGQPVASNILRALHLFGKEHSEKLISDNAAGTTPALREALGERVAAMAALKHDTTGVHPTKPVGGPIANMPQATIENHLKKLIPELDSTVPVLGVSSVQANDALTNAHLLLTIDSDSNRIAGMVNIIAGVSEWQSIKASMVGGNRRRKSRKSRKARKARKSRRSRRSRKSRKSRNYRRARMMV